MMMTKKMPHSEDDEKKDMQLSNFQGERSKMKLLKQCPRMIKRVTKRETRLQSFMSKNSTFSFLSQQVQATKGSRHQNFKFQHRIVILDVILTEIHFWKDLLIGKTSHRPTRSGPNADINTVC